MKVWLELSKKLQLDERSYRESPKQSKGIGFLRQLQERSEVIPRPFLFVSKISGECGIIL